ncbi:unnamed protein product [Fraxinus pennsylvanica]|uniref:Amine oxidase n=1 Tax=Fraxinus pennsylvanica TaxID=56036 RepID=A0AAD1ZVY3_9LAMI|nr:unnamed protein product [Fraxinus pennsylvanica]
MRQKFRSVLCRGHVSETFGSYMDPTPEWYYQTFLDVGEFGFGRFASTLVPLIDRPGNTVYMNGYMAGVYGQAQEVPNANAFSSDILEMLLVETYRSWRTWKSSKITIGEAETNLVVRMVATVGNYDHILDWEFKQSGSFKVEVRSHHSISTSEKDTYADFLTPLLENS